MKFKVGDIARMTKVINQADVETFAEISGDQNPVHLDEQYAAQSMFGKRIAHGMLVSGLISSVLGMQLPGPGSIYLSQTLGFKKPVFFGDEITAVVEVTKVREDKQIISLDTKCFNQDDEIVIDGEAVILLSE